MSMNGKPFSGRDPCHCRCSLGWPANHRSSPRIRQPSARGVFMRGFVLLIGIAAGCLTASSAWSASAHDWANCTGFDMDRRIAGCGNIADGKDETAKDRAMAHYKMASAFAIKGDRLRAIAEFTESINFGSGICRPCLCSARRSLRH